MKLRTFLRTDKLPLSSQPRVFTDALTRLSIFLAAVAGHYLYIDGGEFSYINGDSVVDQYSSSTLSIDLSEDWENGTVVFHSTSKPSDAPNLSYNSLWYDEKNDIFYSGATGRVSQFGNGPVPPTPAIWSFKPDGMGGGTWNQEIGSNDPAWDRILRSYKGYTAAGGDSAFVVAGLASAFTSKDFQYVSNDIQLPGLVQFNMTTKKLTNSTVRGFTSDGEGDLGQMHYVPSFGPNGVFLVMGGERRNRNFDFSNIWVYEAVTNRWYNQTATGNLPEPRREFCVAGVNSTNETYEIFLYGGHDGNLGSDAIPYDEIFILSLPAFRWFKVDYPPQSPRGGHSCNAVGGSQVISIGGIDANSKVSLGDTDEITESTFNSTADPFAQGLGIFNMTTLQWADHYMANAPPYEQSDLIKNFYSNK
ncbi:MAG: hypothetical protein Q9222_007665 [Ikaeria aurantiellina]